jgi:hypothetical protein
MSPSGQGSEQLVPDQFNFISHPHPAKRVVTRLPVGPANSRCEQDYVPLAWQAFDLL